MRSMVSIVLISTGFIAFCQHISAEVVTDGTLGAQTTLSGPDYNISHDLGNIHGNNLYHSFSRFNLSKSESANFSGPGHINNIISRVTGGNESVINGAINSSITGANVFLLNPSGIIFGPDASINISGSFFASTADYIALGTDGRFDASQPDNTVLTVAPPSAFGFVDSDASPISVQDSNISQNDHSSFTLIGGDININANTSEDSQIIAAGGLLQLVSVNSIGEAALDAANIDSGDFERMGRISISGNTTLTTSGAGGGSIIIRGGELILDGAHLSASTLEDASNPTGIGIDIETKQKVLVTNNASINSNVFEGASQNSNDISIRSKELEVTDGAQINAVAMTGSIGSSGAIFIEADNTYISNNALLRANAQGQGNSGNIIVNSSESVQLTDGGKIFSLAFDGSGDGGDIDITTHSLLLSSELEPDSYTTITSQTYTAATAGNININADNIVLKQAEISAPTFGPGHGGDIHLKAKSLSMTGSNNAFWGVFTNTWADGNAGNMNIDISNNIELLNNASFQASTFATGNGGNIDLKADTLQIRATSYIATNGFFGNGGDSGDVNITTRRLLIEGLEKTDNPFGSLESTAIFTGTGSVGGHGGDITINTQQLELVNRAAITSSSFGPDKGGNIAINAGDVSIENGSQISSAAYANGDAGNIAVNTNNLLVSGVHPDPFYNFITGSDQLAPSTIDSTAGANGGNAGSINLQAINIDILDGARISSQAFGSGLGGKINLNADELNISGTNKNSVSFLSDRGFSEHEIELAARAGIFASSNAGLTNENLGNAGEIGILANNIHMSDAIISTLSEAQGHGGLIKITGDEINLSENATIIARSEGGGDAGKVGISANKFVAKYSTISTQALLSNGGNIDLNSRKIFQLSNSAVSTSVLTESGNGGDINIDADSMIIDSGIITAQADSGRGGDITLTANRLLLTPDSVIDATSRQSVSGNIRVTNYLDQTSVYHLFPVYIDDVSKTFSDRCSKNSESLNSFSVIETGIATEVTASFSPSRFHMPAYIVSNELLTLHSKSEFKNRTTPNENKNKRINTSLTSRQNCLR